MSDARPPDVSAWPGVQLGRRLAGGHRNPLFLAHRNSQDLVVRVSGRSPESLDWELDLLDAVRAAGVGVPQTMVTADGRRHDSGVMVQRFIPGGPPRNARDWSRVVSAVSAVHEATQGWTQRPGFASSRALMDLDRGGDVDLGAMPTTGAQLVRAAWTPVLHGPECAIHGDIGAANVLATDDSVTIIDWDEARVVDAGVAWEAATCWTAEPEYAARRLAELADRLL